MLPAALSHGLWWGCYWLWVDWLTISDNPGGVSATLTAFIAILTSIPQPVLVRRAEPLRLVFQNPLRRCSFFGVCSECLKILIWRKIYRMPGSYQSNEYVIWCLPSKFPENCESLGHTDWSCWVPISTCYGTHWKALAAFLFVEAGCRESGWTGLTDSDWTWSCSESQKDNPLWCLPPTNSIQKSNSQKIGYMTSKIKIGQWKILLCSFARIHIFGDGTKVSRCNVRGSLASGRCFKASYPSA